MKRYATDVRDGVLYVETDDDWLEVGPMDEIRSIMGGETYTIEYDERQRTMDWLDTDSEGRLTFDVRETIEGMDYNEAFVAELAAVDADATDTDGHPLRASVFADLMTSIWDSKGELENA